MKQFLTINDNGDMLNIDSSLPLVIHKRLVLTPAS